MIASAARSRLFDLRRERVAAQRSAELLEQKREALLRETLRRTIRRAALRAAVDAAYAEAHRHLAIARLELGRRAVEAAALAQEPQVSIEREWSSIMGIPIAHLIVKSSGYHARYGAASTSASLDESGRAFHALLLDVVALAGEDAALARLRAAMRKTGKLLNALKKVVVPRIERDIRRVLEGIEEEERDEALRRRRWAERRVAAR